MALAPEDMQMCVYTRVHAGKGAEVGSGFLPSDTQGTAELR